MRRNKFFSIAAASSEHLTEVLQKFCKNMLQVKHDTSFVKKNLKRELSRVRKVFHP